MTSAGLDRSSLPSLICLSSSSHFFSILLLMFQKCCNSLCFGYCWLSFSLICWHNSISSIGLLTLVEGYWVWYYCRDHCHVSFLDIWSGNAISIDGRTEFAFRCNFVYESCVNVTFLCCLLGCLYVGRVFLFYILLTTSAFLAGALVNRRSIS